MKAVKLDREFNAEGLYSLLAKLAALEDETQWVRLTNEEARFIPGLNYAARKVCGPSDISDGPFLPVAAEEQEAEDEITVY